MDNLWLLTEERPKVSVVKQIIRQYCEDFEDEFVFEENVKIVPQIENGIFKFTYDVIGIGLRNSGNIYIKTVSGNSSFFDFLLFKQENEPVETSTTDNLIMAIEETKTSDDESRNTGVYQRASKFVYIKAYYENVKTYMLYNDELEAREDKKPSDTSVFGTNMLLTLGVTILGKDTTRWFNAFNSIDELIEFKSRMRRPPAGNVPIDIIKRDNRIEISGRLSKPANAGNIGHDPNIGALSIISQCIRHLGWAGSIIITQHGVSQEYVNRTNGNNKFMYICRLLNVQLEGIHMPEEVRIPDKYWHYEKESEKVTSILLHMVGIYNGMKSVYENHAGCERGYFKTKDNRLIALPKKDTNNINLYLPDVVLYESYTNTVILVEGKKLITLGAGIREIENYDSIEREYIEPHYMGATILRWVSLFGGNMEGYIHEKVLIYVNQEGKIFINPEAPEFVKRMFRNFGVVC